MAVAAFVVRRLRADHAAAKRDLAAFRRMAHLEAGVAVLDPERVAGTAGRARREGHRRRGHAGWPFCQAISSALAPNMAGAVGLAALASYLLYSRIMGIPELPQAVRLLRAAVRRGGET